jgi:Family of unknown function (DUF6114)/zinc-ribbon domain
MAQGGPTPQWLPTAVSPRDPSSAPMTPYRPTERPTAPMILSIVGGVFIALAGIAEIAIGSFLSSFAFGFEAPTFFLFGALGVALGVLIVVFGALLHSRPENHTWYGILILVFSVVSLTSFGGGFLVGFVLALIGGILAIVWKPSAGPVYYMVPQPIQRICPRCGRVLELNMKFCPACGNSLG